MEMMISDTKKAWTRERKDRLLLGILDGRTTVAEVCKDHGLTEPQVETWVMENMERGTSPLLFVWTLSTRASSTRGGRGDDGNESTSGQRLAAVG